MVSQFSILVSILFQFPNRELLVCRTEEINKSEILWVAGGWKLQFWITVAGHQKGIAVVANGRWQAASILELKIRRQPFSGSRLSLLLSLPN